MDLSHPSVWYWHESSFASSGTVFNNSFECSPELFHIPKRDAVDKSLLPQVRPSLQRHQMQRFCLIALTDRIFQQCPRITHRLSSYLLGAVQMSQRRIVKSKKRRNIHIINSSHGENLWITSLCLLTCPGIKPMRQQWRFFLVVSTVLSPAASVPPYGSSPAFLRQNTFLTYPGFRNGEDKNPPLRIHPELSLFEKFSPDSAAVFLQCKSPSAQEFHWHSQAVARNHGFRWWSGSEFPVSVQSAVKTSQKIPTASADGTGLIIHIPCDHDRIRFQHSGIPPPLPQNMLLIFL